MNSLNEMQITLEGIGHVLSDKTLAVPMYQRSYAWTARKEVSLFLQDLATAIQHQENEYFLGSIVVTGGGTSRPEVVDGQQRLATTTILIAAIRDYFHAAGDQERANDIERDYLMVKNLRTQERVPRLQLNELDNDFFSKRVLSPPGCPERQIEATKPSHRRIADAATLAADKVRRLVQQTNRPTDDLVD